MMLVRDLFKLSLHNLLLHKVRSILTSLGVIFGVGSVIAMLAISEGAKQSALAQIEAMASTRSFCFRSGLRWTAGAKARTMPA